jgi:hypothetical protein
MGMQTEWVTVTVAALRLGLSYQQTRSLVLHKKLKGHQVGGGLYGRLLVDTADLARLIRARRRQAS